MTDYVQNLDANSLLTLETVLSLAVAPFTSPPYNLPLFFFGIYTQERSEVGHSAKLFSALLVFSVLLDFIWLLQNSQNGFIKAFSILILILKIPTFFAAHRGTSPIGFTGETVWSMPGGFTTSAHGGYQTLDDDVEARPPPPPSSRPTQPSAPNPQQ